MIDFDTISDWKLEYNKADSTAFISFIAYSKDGQTVTVDNYAI